MHPDPSIQPSLLCLVRRNGGEGVGGGGGLGGEGRGVARHVLEGGEGGGGLAGTPLLLG